MPDMKACESLVNRYVDCWLPRRPQYGGLYEDNDFGCEDLQVFRSGYRIEEFSQDELSQLAVLLTKSLRGQINADHKLFWAWCSFVAIQFERGVRAFADRDWGEAFRSLIDLALAGRRLGAGPATLDVQRTSLNYVNTHLLQVWMDKWLIAAPLALAVLEGLLRRKNGGYVAKDGTVTKEFQLGNRVWRINNRLNTLDDSLRLFEQNTVRDRGRPCTSLRSFKTEMLALYPGTDAYDLIYSWRNDLMHGNQYWMDRVPIVLNLISLLVVDEVDPTIYEAKLGDLQRHVQWASQTQALTGFRTPRNIFPPDLRFGP